MVAAGLATLTAACAMSPPKQLQQAKAMYRQAASGPVARHAPGELQEAKALLDRAEREHRRFPGGGRAEELAYQAQIELIQAEGVAKVAQSKQQLASVRRDLDQLQARTSEAERERLAREQQQLRDEERARAEAEARANEQSIADRLRGERDIAVREDERGTVISLSGTVVFKTGSATIDNVAEERLVGLVSALESDDRHIRIEGHTDSRGSSEMNRRLSERRADAVRDFLVRKGIDSDRIETVGMGEDNPVADNSTSAGRAMNRRVEVVLERPQA